jgi:hypothetical protein
MTLLLIRGSIMVHRGTFLFLILMASVLFASGAKGDIARLSAEGQPSPTQRVKSGVHEVEPASPQSEKTPTITKEQKKTGAVTQRENHPNAPIAVAPVSTTKSLADYLLIFFTIVFSAALVIVGALQLRLLKGACVWRITDFRHKSAIRHTHAPESFAAQPQGKIQGKLHF